MKWIKEQTKINENIKLLKLRDLLYNKAKLLNIIAIFFSTIPMIYTIIINNLEVIKIKNRSLGNDELGVIISILVATIVYMISYKINKYKLDSNILRQLYDCKVFKIRGNKFIIPTCLRKELEDISVNETDKEKYGKWYGEEFIGKKEYDILICQVDNLLYTTYLYQKLKKILDKVIGSILVLMISSIVYSCFKGHIIEVFFQWTVPFSTIMVMLVTVWSKLSRNIDDYNEIIEIIKSDIEGNKIDERYIEALQDKILINRLNDVLIPNKLRSFYLTEGNDYKAKLNEFKQWLIKYNKENIEKLELK